MNNNSKWNGRVSPIDGDAIVIPNIQHVDNGNVVISHKRMEETVQIDQKGFLDHLSNKNEDEDEDEFQEKKKPQVPKLKPFELYKYSDKWDILLMILGTIAALATGVGLPIMMWLFQSVANSLVDIGRGNSTLPSNCYTNLNANDDPFSTIEGIIKWYATLGGASIIAYWIAYGFWMSTAERQLRRIRYKLFQSIMKQEISWFDCRNAGELSSRLIDDLDKIRDGSGFYVADFLCLLSRIIGTLTFAFYTGWKLTLVFLSISPLIILSFNILIRMIVRYTALELKAYSKANGVAQEALGAIRTVTAFSGQNKEVERYENNLSSVRHVGIQKGIVLGIAQGIINIVLYGGISIVFWYGPYLIRTECQNYSPGHFIVVFISSLTSTFLLSSLFPDLQGFAEALGSGKYVFQIIERESKINIFNNDGEIPSNLKGDIEFKNVQFTYPSRQDVSILNSLTVKIPSGKTVALCGPSGCGKSTIVQLIQRFYDPDDGQILLDGLDLRSINLEWLRSNIGIVSQEPVLFFGTIEDNIRLGKSNATQEEIVAATKMANAHDFIMKLPQNYKTLCGDKLSGGQKQRVAIARALISDPKILLLDEATSALDNEGEKIVQDALDKAKEGRTTIVIAHRLSTIKNADIIVGLENGGVVEYGTHNELMKYAGLYYELVMAQNEKENEAKSNNENETEDALTREAIKSTANETRHASRRVPILSRGLSTESAISEFMDEERNDVEREKRSFCSPPLILTVLRLNAPEWFYLLLGAISSLAVGGVMPGFALIFSQIFGALAETDLERQEDEIRTYTYAMFLVGVAGAINQIVSSATFAKAGEELTMRIRILSFKSILRQEIGWFDMDENNLGALVTRLSTDAAALKGFSGPTFSTILNAVGALIAALVISFMASWKLSLVVLSFTPLMFVTGIIQGQRISKAAGDRKTTTSHAEDGGRYATQAIENMRTVVSLHQEQYFIHLYENAFDRDFRKRTLSLHLIAFANALANSLMFFIHAAAFGYGIKLVRSNEISFDGVFRVFSVITFGAIAIGRSAATAPNYSKGKASVKRILELNERSSKIDPEDKSGITLSEVTGNIEFRDVRFRYPARPTLSVLSTLNLICNSGETTALVGPSGSGKSTTVSLIQRFYDPLSGTVLLDGHDVKTLNIRWLRSLLGLVQQEPILFNLSIRDNIAYGDNSRQVTQNEIETVAKTTNIHDLILSLPKGYETSCGAKGGQLSGGQKQRIAIARALIRHPKILLLDEATSALDNKSERVVQEALDQARTGRTCLTIAHRLSTIRNSEKICVVARGRIKESGSHEQLLEQHGIYHKLNTAQERPDDANDDQY